MAIRKKTSDTSDTSEIEKKKVTKKKTSDTLPDSLPDSLPGTIEYYSLDKILKKKATYNIIIGERSNGKTYSVKEFLIKRYIQKKEKFVIIRRYASDVIASRSKSFFNDISDSGMILDLSGTYDHIDYRTGYFYLSYYDEKLDKNIKSNDWCGYVTSLVESEHIKSTSFPNVKNVLFDEFLARDYLRDEFIMFMNTLSTFIRSQTDVKIFMCGNTINPYCPYFDEMGLTHIREQKKGSIDLYEYSNKLKVAVEYCGTINNPSKKFFSFDNPKLSMITSGDWEISIYPHAPKKFDKTDIMLIFFIVYKDKIIQCEIISDDIPFIFMHKKTTEIYKPDSEIIYSLSRSNNPLHFQGFNTADKRIINQKIINLIKAKRIYYSDNLTGEVFRNFFNESLKLDMI